MKKQVNIFICHNPFHVYISSQLCKTYFSKPGFENHIIASIPSFTRVDNVKYQVIRKDFIGRLQTMWKAKSFMNEMVRKHGSNVQFFLPHIHGVLGNYIYSSSWINRKGAGINFYYEGAAMVDMHRKERALDRFVRERVVLSLMLLHHFINYPDILPLDSPRVNKVYTPYPELTETPEEKKVLITFPRSAMGAGTKGVLVVGVDAGDALEEGTRLMIEYIRSSFNSSKVYFKGHYADVRKVFENEAAKKDFPFTPVVDTRCIEEIIGELEVDVIMCTHFSSALLNLKLIYRDDLKVLFLAHPEALKVLGEKYVNLIKSVGVEIIDLR